MMWEVIYGMVILLLLLIFLAGNKQRRIEVLVVSLFFAKELPFVALGDRLMIFDLIFYALLLMFLFQGKFLVLKNRNYLVDVTTISIGAFFMAATASLFYSYNQVSSAFYLLILVEMLLILFFFSNLTVNSIGIKRILSLFAHTFLLIVSLGIIIEFFLPGLKTYITDAETDRWILTFKGPNQLALYSLLAYGIFIVDLFTNKISLVKLAKVVLCIISIIYSGSDLTLALTLVSAAIVIFNTKKTSVLKIIPFVVIIAVFLMLAPGFLAGLCGTNISTLDRVGEILTAHNTDNLKDLAGGTRMTQFANMFQYLERTNYLGAGIGAFSDLFYLTDGIGNEMHNFYFAILVELGIMGFVAFLCIVCGVFLMLRRSRGHDAADLYLKLYVMFVNCLMFAIAHNLLRQRIFWLTLGLIILFYKNAANLNRKETVRKGECFDKVIIKSGE